MFRWLFKWKENKHVNTSRCATQNKPPIISQQCVLRYNYKCDLSLCDAEYVSYSSWYFNTPAYWRPPSFISRRPYQQLFLFKEVHRKTRLICEMLLLKTKRPCLNTQSDSIRAGKTIYLNLPLFTCIFYASSSRTRTVYIIKLSNFTLFSLEKDDMESSKRCVKLLSLIFIIRCFYQI